MIPKVSLSSLLFFLGGGWGSEVETLKDRIKGEG
jgi:hypothetical protein